MFKIIFAIAVALTLIITGRILLQDKTNPIAKPYRIFQGTYRLDPDTLLYISDDAYEIYDRTRVLKAGSAAIGDIVTILENHGTVKFKGRYILFCNGREFPIEKISDERFHVEA